PYDADSPLNRVVDALPPESLAVRRLSRICEAEAAGDPDARGALVEIARTWAQLPDVPSPAELEPLAARLRGLGRSLERVLAGTAEPGTLRAAAEAAAEPVGEYVLAAALVL